MPFYEQSHLATIRNVCRLRAMLINAQISTLPGKQYESRLNID